MPRAIIRERIIELHPAVEQIDAQEFAGDEFAELDPPFTCDSPRGHVSVTSCGETKCVYCGLVFWS